MPPQRNDEEPTRASRRWACSILKKDADTHGLKSDGRLLYEELQNLWMAK